MAEVRSSWWESSGWAWRSLYMATISVVDMVWAAADVLMRAARRSMRMGCALRIARSAIGGFFADQRSRFLRSRFAFGRNDGDGGRFGRLWWAEIVGILRFAQNDRDYFSPSRWRKAMARRFHVFMLVMAWVTWTASASVKWTSISCQAAKGAWPVWMFVMASVHCRAARSRGVK